MPSSFVIPTTEPDSVTAGDAVQWLKKFPTYDPVSYTLSYAAMPITGSVVKFDAVDYGDGKTFWVNVAGATSEAWAPSDDYVVQAYMTDGSGNRQTLYKFPWKIKPDFATATVANYQSAVKQTLDALQTMIQGKASADVLKYEIRGRSLERMTASELIKWYEFYSALYDREIRRSDIERGKPNNGKILARLVSYDGLYPGFIESTKS